MTDPYQVLGISKNATDAEIKKLTNQVNLLKKELAK